MSLLDFIACAALIPSPATAIAAPVTAAIFFYSKLLKKIL
jgi:4-hydroxybenzoate polyprenyltransferase